MAEPKTKATKLSAAKYVAAIKDPVRREDCEVLLKLFTRVTKQKPVMWGAAIVGFGTYHYKSASSEGDWPVVGFSSRKGDISIYVAQDFPERAPLLKKLGKHKTGAACVYVAKLANIDTKVLAELVAASVASTKKRYTVK
jgi:hypothetical protein